MLRLHIIMVQKVENNELFELRRSAWGHNTLMFHIRPHRMVLLPL